ncbi:MAG: hypothetical protein WCN95_07315 [bacterium]
MLILAGCLAGTALLLFGLSRLPSLKRSTIESALSRRPWPDQSQLVESLSSSDWSIFRNIRSTAGNMSSLAQRFRLAGIFCWTPTETGSTGTVRKAIIDNMQVKPMKEVVAIEGDTIDGIVVTRIFEKSIILRDGSLEEELFLAFAGAGTGTVASASSDGSPSGSLGKAVYTNRFGAYMGDSRWVMNRDGLLAYAQELTDSPARAEKLFESMAPVYGQGPGGRRVVEAYKLKVTGEKEFYDAVGLVEGDVVRKVNGEPVTSKRRAMQWINSFRSGSESAFLMDIERDGKPVKLEYMMR